MEIPKFKSQNPKYHDNTEEDLIIIPPSVLDNRLRDFEENYKFRSTIGGDIALAVALILPVLTATFSNLFGITGATIKGVFIAGFVFMTIKISFSLYKIYHTDGHARSDLVKSLLSLNLNSKKNKTK
mgnify:CR=1 FL=1